MEGAESWVTEDVGAGGEAIYRRVQRIKVPHTPKNLGNDSVYKHPKVCDYRIPDPKGYASSLQVPESCFSDTVLA